MITKRFLFHLKWLYFLLMCVPHDWRWIFPEAPVRDAGAFQVQIPGWLTHRSVWGQMNKGGGGNLGASPPWSSGAGMAQQR